MTELTIIKAEHEEFSAFSTARMLLTMSNDEASEGKIQARLEGFNRSQANAVFYILAEAFASAQAGKVTGPMEEAVDPNNHNIRVTIPNVGSVTRKQSPVDGSIEISIDSTSRLALPIHAMQESIKSSKKLFSLAGGQHCEVAGEKCNVLLCPDEQAVNHIAFLMEPIVRGHGYRSDTDIFIKSVTSNTGEVPAIVINSGALAHIMTAENITPEKSL